MDAAIVDGQDRQRRQVADIARQLRERRFANTRREVHDLWRASIRYNIYATLAETCLAVTLIATVLAPRLSRLEAIGALLLAVLTLLGFLAVVLPRVRRWCADELVPALADNWFVVAPSTPARRTDLTASWRRVSLTVAFRGVVAYAWWGSVAAVWLRTPSYLLGVVIIGGAANLAAWWRCRQIDMTWATASTPRDLSAGRPELLVHHWCLLGAYVCALAYFSVMEPSLVRGLLPLVVPSLVFLALARFAVPRRMYASATASSPPR